MLMQTSERSQCGREEDRNSGVWGRGGGRRWLCTTAGDLNSGEKRTVTRGVGERWREKMAGLGTVFFSILNASFFGILLKNAMFFYILF